MPPRGRVNVRGLRELNRALKLMDRDLEKDLKTEIRILGEPVRQASESLAIADIRNITPTWSAMRLGVTTKAGYVAPRARNRGGSKRKNLGALLMRAMETSLSLNETRIVNGFEQMLDRLGRKGGF